MRTTEPSPISAYMRFSRQYLELGQHHLTVFTVHDIPQISLYGTLRM